MASERLQGDEQFHSKNYLLKMPCFYAKMCLKMRTRVAGVARVWHWCCKLD